MNSIVRLIVRSIAALKQPVRPQVMNLSLAKRREIETRRLRPLAKSKRDYNCSWTLYGVLRSESGSKSAGRGGEGQVLVFLSLLFYRDLRAPHSYSGSSFAEAAGTKPFYPWNRRRGGPPLLVPRKRTTTHKFVRHCSRPVSRKLRPGQLLAAIYELLRRR